jgi:acyl homoserine lactone synthase
MAADFTLPENVARLYAQNRTEADMFITIQKHQYDDHAALLDQMFKLRRRVFIEQLHWNVQSVGEQERDAYDDMQPVYLLWVNDSHQVLYGCIRLMPTTGPTLLYDVFRKTFPESLDLIAPDIWEGTRMCVDETRIAEDHPGLHTSKAYCLMLLALCECALEHGIHTMISNYEPHLKRIYRCAGAEVQELGRADGFGKLPVCCGTFEVSQAILNKMRTKLDIDKPLYTKSASKRPPLTEQLQKQEHLLAS